MIKKFILICLFVFGFANYSLSAGSSDNSSSKTKSNYEKAVTLIKSAKKYDNHTQHDVDYINDENEYLNSGLKHTKLLQKTLYGEMVGRIKKTDLTVPYLENDYYYYVRYEEKSEYPIYCRKYKYGFS